MSKTRAAVAAGYSVTRADSQGSVISKRPEIVARIAELTARVEQRSVDRTAISKDMVLQGIVETIELARAANKFSDMLKGYELLGKHLKLWDRALEEIDWDGDLSKLSDEQLHNLAKSLEKIADPAIVAQAKSRLALEAGEIIDVTPFAPAQGEDW